jgi:Ca-activated chloride channel family protein
VVFILASWLVRNRTNNGVGAGPGQVTVTAVLVSGGTPESRPDWDVYEAMPNDSGERKRITYAYREANPRFTLPAGRYRVSAKSGDAVAIQEIEVQPGKLVRAELVFNAGLVDLTAVLVSGGTPESRLDWDVYEAMPNVRGERKRITFAYREANPRFTLPAGRYRVSATFGDAVAIQEIEVQPGKLVKARLVLRH